MKYLIVILMVTVCAAAGASGYGIVNNSSSGTVTPEDSISMVIKSLDSIGNPVSADTFYVLVVGPRGDSVFSEKGTNAGLGRIDSVLMGGWTTYIFKAQVSDIDGAGVIGRYSLQIVARKTSPLYRTINLETFQIVNAELSDALDSAGVAARGGIFTTAQRDSILSALADAVLGNKVWNRAYASSFTAGSMGDSLNNKSPNEMFAVLNDSNRVYRQVGRGIHDSTPRLVAALWNEDTTGNGLANSFGLLLQKAVHGGDSTSIARWVWNTPQSNHSGDGTFGRYLDVEVSSLAAGSGAWSFTVVARDTASNQAVPNAIVSIRNTEQTTLVAVGTTNTYGRAWFNLNSGNYLAIVITPGYNFPAYDTISVSGAGADTVRGYQFNPGAPASPSLCRMYGYLYGVNGVPEPSATIAASLPQGVQRTGTLLVSPFAVSTVSDSAGYFFLDLIPTDSLQPSGSRYEISISRPDGTILRKRVIIPPQANWRLTW